MELYRGTKIAGLKEMKPRLVNHSKAYVYATTDKIESIIYSVKGGNLNYTNIYGYDDNINDYGSNRITGFSQYATNQVMDRANKLGKGSLSSNKRNY